MCHVPKKMAESDWRPSASLDVIRKRAELLQQVRAFFHARDVLEVDTPAMSSAGNTDPNIESIAVPSGAQTFYLHTSPEFAMKRLLAAGSGSIYQICKVFRQGESGRYHNPEFTMLEWYRPGFDQYALMDEVETLFKTVLINTGIHEGLRISYRQAFMEYAGIDPLGLDKSELVQHAARLGFAEVQGLTVNDRDAWLELLFAQVVVPKLPNNKIVFIYDYPASQAALAKIRQGEGVAERFEVYINGVELANGFHELTDATEQRQRFENDNTRRTGQGKKAMPLDENLLQSLEAGLPECAGVALGIDRLLMLRSEGEHINDVLAFPADRA
jgi:lysyl-tRNA synthetase class 2